MPSLLKAPRLRGGTRNPCSAPRLLLGIVLAGVIAGCGGFESVSSPTKPANNPETTSASTTQPPNSALDTLLPTAEEIGTEGRVTTRNGRAQALHGLLGRKGSSYDFSLRAFDVRRSEFSNRVPGAGVVVTQIEQWASGGEAGYRLYDWLGTGGVPAAEQQGGFVNRLRTFGIPATNAEIERYTLPPGLAQESFGATIHFRGRAADLSADDVVVLFRCDRLVGSVDVVGKPGTVELSDAIQVATSMASGMGEVCAV